MTKPTRWSYSSISTYESCPAKWKFSYIDGLPYKPSAAMERGTRLHSDCERYVKGELQVMPWELNKVALRLEDLRMKKAQAEAVWLLDQDWANTIRTPWIKAIIDVHWLESDGTVLQLRDYKSGREYPDHRSQLELYAVIGLCTFPEVKRAEYGAIYLDTGHVSNEGSVLRGDMLDKKREDWNNRAIRIFADNDYNPNPNPNPGGACSRCDYSKAKGGPCVAA